MSQSYGRLVPASTIKERLRHAITTSDAEELRVLVDMLRLRGLDYAGRYRNLPYIGVLKPVEPKAVAQR